MGLREFQLALNLPLKMLAQIRNLRLALSEINHDRWRENEDDLRGREIDEMHFGFIGLGRIGKKLTKFLSPSHQNL